MIPGRSRVNVLLMIASLVVSMILWAVVYPQSQPPENTRSFNARLYAQGLDFTKFAVTGSVPTVHVYLHGPDDAMEPLTDRDIEARADLSTATSGKNYYPVQIWISGKRPRLIKPEPVPNVQFEIEPVMTRTLSVSVESTGSLADGYVLDDKSIEPKRVKVVGPRSQVLGIQSVRAVLDLDIVDTKNPHSQLVEIQPIAENSRTSIEMVRTEPTNVTITPVVNLPQAEKSLYVTPDLKGKPAPGFEIVSYQTEPNPITIRGKNIVLAALTKLSTVPISIADIKTTTTFLSDVKLPTGTTLKTRQVVKVRVVVQATKLLGAATGGG